MFGHKIKSKNTYHDDDDESKHTVTHIIVSNNKKKREGKINRHNILQVKDIKAIMGI